MNAPLVLPSPNRVGRSELGRVVGAMNSGDISKSLEIIAIATNPAKRLETADQMIALLRDTSASSALKLVGFHVLRASRKFSDPCSQGYLSVLRELAWLRCMLQCNLLVRATARNQLPADLSGMQASEIESDPIGDAIGRVYELGVGRSAAKSEIDVWKHNFSHGLGFAEFVCLMAGSPESEQLQKMLPQLDDGRFIQLVYETILSRGCTAKEIARWQEVLTIGRRTRAYVVNHIFSGHIASLGAELQFDNEPVHDGLSFNVMGTDQFVSVADWKLRKENLISGAAQPHKLAVFHSRFHIKQAPKPLISAITSLYRGGKFIEQFMENITSQNCFKDYCELVIIDADSPENESAVIERFCRQHKNIVYRRMNYRIGIYEAWNVGAQASKGEYLTNANLDDLRSVDSLELQAGVLENLPFVDVVYQDFLYTFDPMLSYEQAVEFGYQSRLPVINAYNLMDFNSPHNAPMWRKKLHADLGFFDTFYKSAGDYEFWMRCKAANKVFYKINNPHVVYYQNPQGLSTRPDTRGIEEAKRILKKYGRRLISDNVVMPLDRFEQGLPFHVASSERAASRYMTVQKALRGAAIMGKYGQSIKGRQS